MEKAYKLEFENAQQGSLSVNCCGCSKTEPLHSFLADLWLEAAEDFITDTDT